MARKTMRTSLVLLAAVVLAARGSLAARPGALRLPGEEGRHWSWNATQSDAADDALSAPGSYPLF